MENFRRTTDDPLRCVQAEKFGNAISILCFCRSSSYRLLKLYTMYESCKLKVSAATPRVLLLNYWFAYHILLNNFGSRRVCRNTNLEAYRPIY